MNSGTVSVMEPKTLVEKLDEIADRTSVENIVFLRPHGAIVALSKIMESKVIDDNLYDPFLNYIRESSDDINQLLWTVPKSRSYFRKLIVEYLDGVDTNEPDILVGCLRHFQNKPMPRSLRNTFSNHLHENSVGLVSALNIWSKLRQL